MRQVLQGSKKCPSHGLVWKLGSPLSNWGSAEESWICTTWPARETQMFWEERSSSMVTVLPSIPTDALVGCGTLAVHPVGGPRSSSSTKPCVKQPKHSQAWPKSVGSVEVQCPPRSAPPPVKRTKAIFLKFTHFTLVLHPPDDGNRQQCKLL